MRVVCLREVRVVGERLTRKLWLIMVDDPVWAGTKVAGTVEDALLAEEIAKLFGVEVVNDDDARSSRKD